MNEIWKDIPGYEGKYEVSNLGNVRSLNYNRSGEPKLLKQGNVNGYKVVILYKDGKKKTCNVHRLVAMTFIPNPDNLPIVNHKDEDKSNNNVNNLEWCTYKYNNTYGTARERAGKKMRGENHPLYGKHHSEEHRKKISESLKGENSPLYGKHFSEEHRKKLSESKKGKYKGKDSPNAKPILMYDREGNFIRRFDSIVDANEYFGKDRGCSSICNCLREKRKTTYGFIFKYEDKEND